MIPLLCELLSEIKRFSTKLENDQQFVSITIWFKTSKTKIKLTKQNKNYNGRLLKLRITIFFRSPIKLNNR